MDKLIHGIVASGDARLFAAITTASVTEAVLRHGTSPTTSAALGRMLTGVALLGSSFKDFDRLTVKIECNGPVGGITVEADKDGHIRGYVKNPNAETPAKSNGKFDVRGIIGEGNFYVIREAGFEIGFRPEPYIGSVPIISGEIAEDLAFYLAKSEQIPSAVLLGVLLQNKEPYVTAAGGLMVQMLPDANEHIVTMIEDTISRAPHVTELIKEGARPIDLAKMALGDLPFEVLEDRDVSFKCTCSLERARTMVAALGREEVESMLAEDKGAVMTCGFCNEIYQLDEQDLVGILNSENPA
ncbi:MAG TPA: Hsp33 family molecular chaperone HslO [Pyrinomonadaceae bacterium]|nr:Hsp33 family molecular chaperone HslO [Pyrinomonadaceae bacterium]